MKVGPDECFGALYLHLSSGAISLHPITPGVLPLHPYRPRGTRHRGTRSTCRPVIIELLGMYFTIMNYDYLER